MMPKREIKEFISIAKMHPECKYVIVEGETDYKFLKWLYRITNKTGISIIKVENINICIEDIFELFNCTENNNRRRIIAFSHKIATAGITPKSILCLIDKDFEHYINTIPETTNRDLLILTEYNSLDCFFIDDELISKHITLSIGDFFIETKSIISYIENVLREIYAIRLINEKQKLNNSWLELKKFIDLSEKEMKFKKDDFIIQYLAKNSKTSILESFLTEYALVLTSLDTDLRLSVRGHDFTYILWMYISSHSNKYKIKYCDFETYLLNCIEINKYLDSVTIQELLAI